MIENLKIAFRKQKRLIAVFFLTIFIPSVALSIFGVTAIRNEEFRLERQTEEELRRIAVRIKTQIHKQIEDVEGVLQDSVKHPSFAVKDYPDIKVLLDDRLHNHPMVEQTFLLYEDEDAMFPLLRPPTVKPVSLPQSQRSNSQPRY